MYACYIIGPMSHEGLCSFRFQTQTVFQILLPKQHNHKVCVYPDEFAAAFATVSRTLFRCFDFGTLILIPFSRLVCTILENVDANVQKFSSVLHYSQAPLILRCAFSYRQILLACRITTTEDVTL